MTRTVIVGTPRALERISLRDLPADKNLDFSFWRYVDFSGLDLSDYSMEDVDIIDYDAHGASLPECPFSQFRFPVDNTGLVLHPDTSSFNHDLMAAMFQQASNFSEPVITRIFNYSVKDTRARGTTACNTY